VTFIYLTFQSVDVERTWWKFDYERTWWKL